MAKPAAPLIDLDAAKRETQYPDGIPVRLGGVEFTLPAELPAEILDPIVDLDLPKLLKDVMESLPEDTEDADEGRTMGEVVLDVLTNNPSLPRDIYDAIKGAFAALFGPEQYPEFEKQRPSINDYARLAQALMPLYGVGLGEALGSPDSSESGGETSKQTSPATTESTPAASGKTPKRKGSSASAG